MGQHSCPTKLDGSFPQISENTVVLKLVMKIELRRTEGSMMPFN